MIWTQMNADFQDSIGPRRFFGVYLRKSASPIGMENVGARGDSPELAEVARPCRECYR
jgi:hypothetical protein